MIRSVKFTCPTCGKRLAPADGMQSATQIIKRSCKCGDRWQIKIEPRAIRGGMLDFGTFTAIGELVLPTTSV
jgi:hypothetical protein